MSTVFEVLTEDTFSTAVSGTSYFSSGSLNGIGTHIFLTESYVPSYVLSHASGSWQGMGVMVNVASGSIDTNLLFPQGWTTTTTQDVASSSPALNHVDSDITSVENPNVLEGSNVISWNPFPALPVVSTPVRKQRDESRFKRVSSFSRFRPVRIRLFRHNVTVR